MTNANVSTVGPHERALVVLSGGQDSTTCLYWALQNFREVHTITFDYGQKHRCEIIAAARISELAPAASHQTVTLGEVLKGSSPLTNSDEELEQYADHQSLPGGLEKTFVPMRNQLFLTVAANRAYVLNCRNLITGVCQEDSGGYPDCRQDFIELLEDAINAGTFTGEPGTVRPLAIHTPLMNLTKADSIHLARGLKGCYAALAYTHTAYDGQYPPVGHDHANLLRAKGFEEADVPDPLVLRAYGKGLMDLPSTENYSLKALEEVYPLLGPLLATQIESRWWARKPSEEK